MRTVLITGAAGFLGASLTESFASKGWRVIASSSRDAVRPNSQIEWRKFDLWRNTVPRNLLEGIDYVVHAAVIKGKGQKIYDANVSATRALFSECERHDIPGAFVSSLAAHPNAISGYGKHKYLLERDLGRRRVAIVRPGLILGNGGLFHAMRNHVARRGLIPLIDGGEQPLQTVHLEDVTLAIIAAAHNEYFGTYTVAEKQPVAYKHFFETMCRLLGVEARFINLPFRLLRAAIGIAEAMQLPLPIDQDNVLGLAAMEAQDASTGDVLVPRGVRDHVQSLGELVGTRE